MAIRISKPSQQILYFSGFGQFNKLAMEFDEVFWPRNSSLFFLAPKDTSQSGLLNIWLNYTVLSGAPVLVAFCNGDEAKTCESMEDEELLQTGKLTDNNSEFSKWFNLNSYF